MTPLSFALVWFLSGYMAGSYIFADDVYDGGSWERPAGVVLKLCFCGVLAPIMVLCMIFCIWESTEPKEKP
jgi:hypothetical protein